MKNGIVKLGKLEIDLRELAEFVANAKKNCYAGNGKEERAEDGSKVLTFQEGDFHYTDNYDGFYQAPGSEIVKWQKPNGQRIWQMSYCGGMLQEYWGSEAFSREVFAFLKEVLKQVTPERPFRGPESHDGKGYFYDDNLTGDLTRFSGQEEIGNIDLDKIVFRQDYIGGLIIPK